MRNSWLRSFAQRNGTSGRRGRCSRIRPAVEALESRTLLSASPDQTDTLLQERRPLDDATGFSEVALDVMPEVATSIVSATSGHVDAGDYFVSYGRPKSLLRFTGRLVVQFEDGTDQESSISALTGTRGELRGWEGRQRVTDVASVLSGEETFPLEPLRSRVARRADVASVSPVFYDPEAEAELILLNEVIVVLDPEVDPNRFFEGKAKSFRRMVATDNHYVVTVDGGGLEALESSVLFSENSAVLRAEPNFHVKWETTALPNDTLIGDQWHAHNTGQNDALNDADVDLEEAWDVETGSGAIVIAVLDDGVQTAHPDLNIFINTDEIPADGIDNDGNGYVDDVNGWDFVSGDNDANPPAASANHGTAVAGVAGAIGNNNLGVTGAAQDVQILPIRVLGSGSETVTIASFAEAVHYASGRTADGSGTWRGADILNHSYRVFSSNSEELDDAFDWAADNGRGGLGAPSFVATGNSSGQYIEQTATVTGVPAGNWAWVLSYEKDGSGSTGEDTAWLGQFRNSDGTTHHFNSLTPAGWGL